MGGLLGDTLDRLEGEFGERLEEATEATDELRKEVEDLRRVTKRRAKATEDLVKEIRGLRRDLDERD